MSAASYKIGDRVSYEDMANPRKVGTVTRVFDGFWAGSFYEFQVRFDDGEMTVSDMLQSGWRLEDDSPTYRYNAETNAWEVDA